MSQRFFLIYRYDPGTDAKPRMQTRDTHVMQIATA
jgi:hypothetical protein